MHVDERDECRMRYIDPSRASYSCARAHYYMQNIYEGEE